MANREENLKKINDTLEQLSDEELEKVAGGDMWDALKMWWNAQIAKVKRQKLKKVNFQSIIPATIIDYKNSS